MADADKAALYLKWILEELGITMDPPTPIHAGNQRFNTNGQLTIINAKNATRRNETLCYITMDR